MASTASPRQFTPSSCRWARSRSLIDRLSPFDGLAHHQISHIADHLQWCLPCYDSAAWHDVLISTSFLFTLEAGDPCQHVKKIKESLDTCWSSPRLCGAREDGCIRQSTNLQSAFGVLIVFRTDTKTETRGK